MVAGAEAIVGGATGPAGLLASVQYAPATAGSSQATSTTVVAADTTHLTILFTAPASGNVLVRLTGLANIGVAGTAFFWGVATHNTTTIQGVLATATESTTVVSCSCAIKITGLTPGNSYQWDWVLACGAAHTGTLYYSGITVPEGVNNDGPAVMEVWAA